ncbi:hypothetical protein [uncultured Tateyamaria sp.]|uniref:hypothetical protein n=1 Tax=uncultured Tateyamaria sp. TaxID=455651 RepID=UPI00260C7F0B|nr:hypothetical protein [uncultured Tateyamaria sp.]
MVHIDTTVAARVIDRIVTGNKERVGPSDNRALCVTQRGEVTPIRSGSNTRITGERHIFGVDILGTVAECLLQLISAWQR